MIGIIFRFLNIVVVREARNQKRVTEALSARKENVRINHTKVYSTIKC